MSLTDPALQLREEDAEVLRYVLYMQMGRGLPGMLPLNLDPTSNTTDAWLWLEDAPWVKYLRGYPVAMIGYDFPDWSTCEWAPWDKVQDHPVYDTRWENGHLLFCIGPD